MQAAAGAARRGRRRPGWSGVVLRLSLLLAFAHALPLLRGLPWFAELPAHFPAHTALAALLLGGLAIASRSRVAAIVNAVVLASALTPLWLAAVAAPTVAPSVTILSQNLSFRQQDFERFRELAVRRSPDLIALQEYTPEWHAALAELRSGYPHSITEPRAGAFGIALYSRLPLEDVEAFGLGDFENPTLSARVSSDRFVGRILNVHLMPPMEADWAADHARQVNELAVKVADLDEPVVIVGDFNDTPGSPTMRRFMERTGLRFAPPVWLPTWPDRLGVAGIAIDLAVMSPGVGAAERERVTSVGSDHRGVWLEVHTPSRQ